MKTRHTVQYIPSATRIRPVAHSLDLAVPEAPKSWHVDEERNETINETTRLYSDETMGPSFAVETEPHLITRCVNMKPEFMYRKDKVIG